CMQTLEFPPTF
nr:immunoglobulin light chain junction region [Macaca mulatta]MOW11915.1 immunoglobulin light chain junction region [Macaca mulatta]MOW12671.1 immunoglobulin light chain junction region [Macaca mulatta]MOW13785.1 immunoglobulin light chain junction region [Macaca mulatta]MOX99235.1 immunoglobulin light chain junction region [Macaca mulatta]